VGLEKTSSRCYFDCFLTKRYSKATITTTAAIVVPSNTGAEEDVSVIIMVEKDVVVVA